jgi:hypothetical protein
MWGWRSCDSFCVHIREDPVLLRALIPNGRSPSSLPFLPPIFTYVFYLLHPHPHCLCPREAPAPRFLEIAWILNGGSLFVSVHDCNSVRQ